MSNLVSISPTSSKPTFQHAQEKSHARKAYQKGQRRKETLFKKAFEYSTQCDADVQLVVRIRKTGKIFTLTSKSEGWPLSAKQLDLTHPLPIRKTTDELARQYEKRDTVVKTNLSNSDDTEEPNITDTSDLCIRAS
ncbi:uncharacterized protein N7511_000805 [Penicillium nucicola]|uniref:uncharacterized protein n=1 Tax=Penicillium nucicola TaxID=1850975 RepID=UPI002545B170|nr:uncharacterized protein N7511_000805 [Penicillium nucicola]KAJ5775794.1 hypothetical protein N7511_000805 [Penicillium nucicola]